MVNFLARNGGRPGQLRTVLRADKVVRPAGDPFDTVAVFFHPGIDFSPLVGQPLRPLWIFGHAPACTLPVFLRSAVGPPFRIVHLQLWKSLGGLVLGILHGFNGRCHAEDCRHGKESSDYAAEGDHYYGERWMRRGLGIAGRSRHPPHGRPVKANSCHGVDLRHDRSVDACPEIPPKCYLTVSPDFRLAPPTIAIKSTIGIDLHTTHTSHPRFSRP